MKAIRIHEYGGPEYLRFEDCPIPTPAAGQVLVKVEACGVNPVDAWFRSGHLKAHFARPLPFIPGWEVAGTIVETGVGVTRLTVGERVFGMLNFAADGAYAEYVVTDASRLSPIPSNMTSVDAAALPIAGLTGVQLVETVLDCRPGDRILIAGALGAVGRAAVHAAQLRGARVIAGVRKNRLAEARQLGADDYLAIDDPDAVAQLAGAIQSIVDTVGPAALAPLYGTVAPGGKIVTVVPLPTAPADPDRLAIERHSVKPDPDRLAKLAEDVVGGKFALPDINVLALSDAENAHSLMAKGGLRRKFVLTDC
ncbi:NADP-dependent oxidoreductase [Noviherbaspirillum sedimenti]|uniref:NADP-dependent oxidoreductase n=2 Tax=Noviherbaspirillum sedimenti TaxID=2320865 RepID=A0A3A3G161_9BURK|nr:NADP-dependent oxidoreductase [Noviherbaspirillum sedimenti]